MDNQIIIDKFGFKYAVSPDTFHMGIHQVFGSHLAQRFTGHNRVLDACLGGGFTALHLTQVVDHVVGVDINPQHLDLAKENVHRKGLQQKVSLLYGDITNPDILQQVGPIDAAFLDPDWAIPGTSKESHVTSLNQMQPDGDLLFSLLWPKTHNIALRLPKELDLSNLKHLPPHTIETFIMDGKVKFYCVYFGDLVGSSDREEFSV